MRHPRSTDLLIALCNKVSSRRLNLTEVKLVPQRELVGNANAVKIIFGSLLPSTSQEVLATVLSVGSYLEDEAKIDGYTWEAVTLALERLETCHDEESKLLELRLARESFQQIADLKRSLISNTSFALPKPLIANNPISFLAIRFGANQTPLELLSNGDERVILLDEHPAVLETISGGSLEIIFLEEDHTPQTLKSNLLDFCSQNLKAKIERFKIPIRSSYRVYFNFDPAFEMGIAYFQNMQSLRNVVEQSVCEQMSTTLSSQVDDLNLRIEHVSNRSKFYVGGVSYGLTPSNEHETVLLCDRILRAQGNSLLGARIEILDYSPKGIDSIARFSPSSSMPIRPVAAEFEYHLRNFFLHGHDPSQIELIICFTMDGLSMPFTYCGIDYELDQRGLIPRLNDGVSDHKPYVFILDKIFHTA